MLIVVYECTKLKKEECACGKGRVSLMNFLDY